MLNTNLSSVPFSQLNFQHRHVCALVLVKFIKYQFNFILYNRFHKDILIMSCFDIIIEMRTRIMNS